MYTLTHYVFCEKIEETPDKKQHIIIGPLSSFRLRNIPGQFSFFFSVGISGVDVEKPLNHVKAEIIAPNNDVVLETNGEIPTPENNGRVEDSVTMALDVRNMVFEVPGTYKLSLTFNNEHIGDFQFCVHMDEPRSTIEQKVD